MSKVRIGFHEQETVRARNTLPPQPVRVTDTHPVIRSQWRESSQSASPIRKPGRTSGRDPRHE